MKKTNYKKLVHFFGELDLDLTKTSDQVYKKAFDISECCGYMVTRTKYPSGTEKITLYGREGEVFKLWFKPNKKLAFIISDKKYLAKEIPSGEGTGYGGYF